MNEMKPCPICKREPDRDIHYWDVKDGEWIMMYTNPPLPQPPQEGE